MSDQPRKSRSVFKVLISVFLLLVASCGILSWLALRGCADAVDARNRPVGERVASDGGGQEQTDAGPTKPFAVGEKIRVGSTEITVTGAYVGPIKLRIGPASVANGRYTVVHIAVTNTSGDRKIAYRSWTLPFRSTAKLQDDIGNSYTVQQLMGAPDGKNIGEALYPRTQSTEVLAFEPPVNAAKKLVLTLPASAVGETGVVQFELDCEKLTR